MAATWIDVNSNYQLTAEPELVTDLQAVKNSIENILSTPIGSRPFQRDYGSKLYQFLQEPMDRITEEDIRVSLIQALEKWEVRIVVDGKRTSINRLRGDVGYRIDIYFTLIVPSIKGSLQFIAKRI